MVNPNKIPKLAINLSYEWYTFKDDGLLFINMIKVGSRKYQMEGVVIDVAREGDEYSDVRND